MTVKREDRIVRVRAIKDYELRAMALPTVPAYWVTCRVCLPTSTAPGDFFSALMGDVRARLGWAPSWQLAMSFADAHAALHADKACPTCQHIPETTVTLEDTNALMQVRSS